MCFSSESAARIEAAFAEQIGPARFHLWFPANARFEPGERGLILVCRNAHFRDWAREQFGTELLAAVHAVAGEQAALDYSVDANRLPDPPPADEPAAPRVQRNLFGEIEPARAPKGEARPNARRRWKSLKEFVVGPCNRVAAAAAAAAIEEPGLGPNPLVIHGPVGTGKTHLLEAICAGLAPRKPLFLAAEEFTHRFVQSARRQGTGGFRNLTRNAGAFLLDDLAFLARKRATQEELLHVIDAHLAEGNPVVFALDTHPRLADDLIPELVDRLLGGAAWGLLPPDDETRLAILKAKAAIPLADDVLRHLAKNITGNVRELEGALHCLRHYAKVTGETITLPLARDILGELLRRTVRAVTLEEIDAATCRAFRLPPGSLQGARRQAAIAQPRMLAVYLARRHTAATFGDIARYFGVKQHSTAVAAEKRVRQTIDRRGHVGDMPAADALARIERELFR